MNCWRNRFCNDQMSLRNRRLSHVFSVDEEVDGIPDVFHVGGRAVSGREGSQPGNGPKAFWMDTVFSTENCLQLPPSKSNFNVCFFFSGMLFIREVYFIQFYFIHIELSPLLCFKKDFISCYLQFMHVNYLLEQQVVFRIYYMLKCMDQYIDNRWNVWYCLSGI